MGFKLVQGLLTLVPVQRDRKGKASSALCQPWTQLAAQNCNSLSPHRLDVCNEKALFASGPFRTQLVFLYLRRFQGRSFAMVPLLVQTLEGNCNKNKN